MEWLVGALVVLGFLAISVRFLARDSSGRIRLPGIVDDSIGMWALRRLTGLSLGARMQEAEPSAAFDRLRRTRSRTPPR